MSWQIPTLIEADIKSGKAQYRTFQTGNGGQSILPVPPNSYAVIFGYDFSPAGGGISFRSIPDSADFTLLDKNVRWFETQQISFYTGTDFYPFIHHVDVACWGEDTTVTANFNSTVVNTPISRQVYITSSNDVTITHGLILNSPASQNAIPVTNRTPLGLTYGGSGQNTNTQTNFGPALTPLQFMQPSVKDYADFAFGLLPANADGQAFATPDATNGLLSASTLLNTFGDTFRDAAACQYYLCLHYALYTETVPESRG